MRITSVLVFLIWQHPFFVSWGMLPYEEGTEAGLVTPKVSAVN